MENPRKMLNKNVLGDMFHCQISNIVFSKKFTGVYTMELTAKANYRIFNPLLKVSHNKKAEKIQLFYH